jgi:hypothetical protein
MKEARPHIGTLREKPLHASLKQRYAEPGDQVEVSVDGFIIDVVREDLLVEIQTRGFSSMKRKVTTLLDNGHRVRIVHPIAVNKWIVKVEGDGTILDRRLSPKHGHPIDLFSELVSFPELIAHPDLEIDLVLTNEEEWRAHTPGKSWRRHGWSVLERRLIEVVDAVPIRDGHDLVELLPTGLPDPFSTADIADRIVGSRRLAQQMAYCLKKADLIVPDGKIGNAVQYIVA